MKNAILIIVVFIVTLLVNILTAQVNITPVVYKPIPEYVVTYEVAGDINLVSPLYFDENSDVFGEGMTIDCPTCPSTIIVGDNILVRFFGVDVRGNLRFDLGENSEVQILKAGMESPYLSIINTVYPTFTKPCKDE